MKKRYGYVYVDLDDLGQGSGKRYKKKSFYWYKTVIESNGGVFVNDYYQSFLYNLVSLNTRKNTVAI